jgi:hypothetical protein
MGDGFFVCEGERDGGSLTTEGLDQKMTCELIVLTSGKEVMNRFLDIWTVWAVCAFDFAETMEVSIERGMAGAKRHV